MITRRMCMGVFKELANVKHSLSSDQNRHLLCLIWIQTSPDHNGIYSFAFMNNLFCRWNGLCTYVRLDFSLFYYRDWTEPHSAVGNVSGNRCESACRFRGRELDPGPVPYFRGDWSWNNFYGHSPPFGWIIQGLLSVTSESMCTKYWLTACSSLPRKKGG